MRAAFAAMAKDRVVAIQHHVSSSLQALRGLAGLYAASEHVDREDFKIYAQHILRHHPEIMGLEWVPRVTHAMRLAMESGKDDSLAVEFFEFKEGKAMRASRRQEYYPVYFLEPLSGNEGALGFDLATNDIRRKAMEQARDTAELTVTERVRLLAGPRDQFGLLAFLPVYARNPINGSVEDRRRALQGYVMAVFRVPEMVELSLVGLRPIGMSLWVYDESAPEHEQLLYQHRSLSNPAVPAALPSDASFEARFSWSTVFDVGGRLWRIQSFATRDFFRMHRTWLPWGVLLIGLLLTGLLTTVLLNRARRELQVERLVTKRTALLSQEIVRRRRFEEALSRAKDELEQKVHERTKELSEVNATLGASYEQVKHLALQLQSIREDERVGIARELHDELGQALTALKMDLVWISGRLPSDATLLRERSRAMTDLIDRMVKTIQHISASLRPALLDDFGLLEAIRWQIREFTQRTQVACGFDSTLAHLELDRAQATAFFRIFQEALTNVARHAQATTVSVRLTESNGLVALEVVDNGIGLQAPQLCDKQAIGLIGMRERALLLNGSLTITGEPGLGTTVCLRMPISIAVKQHEVLV